jgi:hypothetical protein
LASRHQKDRSHTGSRNPSAQHHLLPTIPIVYAGRIVGVSILVGLAVTIAELDAAKDGEHATAGDESDARPEAAPAPRALVGL